MCEEKKHLVRVHYHDHTGTDEVKLFQSLKDAAEGIRKDLENCQKKFFSDGNFAMQEAENLTEIWDTEGMAFCIWEYAGIYEV